MDELVKIKVIIPDSIGLDFEDAEIPKIVQIEKAESEYVNFDGLTLGIVVLYIFDKIADGIGNKIGEDIYDFTKNLILKKSEENSLMGSIETPDFKVNFDFKSVSKNNLIVALDSFLEVLKTLKTPDTTIKESDLRFDNESKKWLPKDALVDYFKQKLNEVSEDNND